ncbi:Putative heavy-metal-binding [Caminicella sporogenes DSM 14501]|uniref:Putative heavy-metal-binding n=1 Tax=Caminicella sporogenes DSM 14501 TaxID=1121266 RepID=A0A1M6N087_9FIRM|nr:heavy metal-binding domain-containing protein [Caminicella sporogenes]RKD22416.1 hypothetical protein BET04_05130 [Caminicella sporogenes]SHJ89155.1 Putative heavy-metal-binding [Caminicella sporogenes DSM 14501]
MNNILISTGDIKDNYQIIDTIFAMDSHKESFFKNADPNKAFNKVKEQLRQECKKIGGNAVINCLFEYRVALDSGLIGSKQVIEIFAYGTAVKIL